MRDIVFEGGNYVGRAGRFFPFAFLYGLHYRVHETLKRMET